MNRTFDSGANRNSAHGKFEYHGFNHPVLEQIFASYMHQHRKLEDGTLRESNNWWKGWDREISLSSLNRHLQDLNAIHAGYIVIKFKTETGEHTKYITPDEYMREWGEHDGIEVVSEADCCSAIRFNAMAYLLETVDKPKRNKTESIKRLDLTEEDDTNYSTKRDI